MNTKGKDEEQVLINKLVKQIKGFSPSDTISALANTLAGVVSYCSNSEEELDGTIRVITKQLPITARRMYEGYKQLNKTEEES